MFRFYTRKRRTVTAPDFLRRIAKASVMLVLCSHCWPQPGSAHDLEGSVFLMSRDGASVLRISVVDGTDTPCWMRRAAASCTSPTPGAKVPSTWFPPPERNC